MKSTVNGKEMLIPFLNPELFVADATLGDVAEDEGGDLDGDDVAVDPAETLEVEADGAEPLDVDAAELLDCEVAVAVAFTEWLRYGETRADAGSVEVASGDGVTLPVPPPVTAWLLVNEAESVAVAVTS